MEQDSPRVVGPRGRIGTIVEIGEEGEQEPPELALLVREEGTSVEEEEEEGEEEGYER